MNIYDLSDKAYTGKVSIWKNTKDKLVLEANPDGNWSNDDVEALYAKLKSLAKEHNATINLFKLDKDANELVMGILTGRGGHPYLAMIPKDGGTKAKKRVKLA